MCGYNYLKGTSTKLVCLETSDSIETVSQFYQSEFATKGWTIDQRDSLYQPPKLMAYTAAKDIRPLQVQVVSDNGHVLITQTVTNS